MHVVADEINRLLSCRELRDVATPQLVDVRRTGGGSGILGQGCGDVQTMPDSRRPLFTHCSVPTDTGLMIRYLGRGGIHRDLPPAFPARTRPTHRSAKASKCR